MTKKRQKATAEELQKLMDAGQYTSTHKAHLATGYSQDHIEYLASKNKIDNIKPGGAYLVSIKSIIEYFKNKKTTRGKPAKIKH